MTYRIETDSLGDMQIPSQAYYGVHTQRALDNFAITGVPISTYPRFIIAFAMVKKACAFSNHKLGNLDDKVFGAIDTACDKIIDGQYHDEFVVDLIQGGAGTSTNMNANEVIANVALEVLGEEKGNYDIVSPLDHVNLAQSTNDTYPTSIRLSILLQYKELLEAIATTSNAFLKKSKEFKSILKMGRTQLQDAVPMTLGQEFAGFGNTLAEDIERLEQMARLFCEINLGATAIGTGINTHPEYAQIATDRLSEISGYKMIMADDMVEATSDMGAFIMYSSVLKRVAVKISKISNDLRLLSSGPLTGLGEINLPAVQAGSSIMPGKVNPVIPEAVTQVAYQVIGNDLVVTMCAEAGQMQLNAFEPTLALNLMRSSRILRNALLMLTDKCIIGITANEDVCASYVANNPGLATALTPHIGYKNASIIAKRCLKERRPVRDLVLEEGFMDEKALEEALRPENLIAPHA